MEHVFGKPETSTGLGIGERLCNEPVIRGAIYVRIYHLHFTLLPNGDAKCNHCPEVFERAQGPK